MRVWVTPHATSRYVERVKPCMEARHACWELGQLCLRGRVVERPGWLDGENTADAWLEISDGIVVGIARPARASLLPAAITVLVRGGMNDARRRRLNERKQQRVNARRTRNRMERGCPMLGRDFALSDDYA